jgi:hypothetical protein
MMWGVTIPYDIGPDSHPSGRPFRNVFDRNRSSGGDPVAWLRAEVEADLSAARIISSGGFSPQRWDTEPPGQVNPDHIPQDAAVTAALGCEPEYVCGWVQLVAYDKLNNAPDEAYGRDSEAPFALVDNGRREFEHIIRHDPRNEAARCEAALAILDECETALRIARTYKDGDGALALACAKTWRDAVRLLARGYRHRPGYREEDWQ